MLPISAIMGVVAEHEATVNQLVDLIQEFKLESAELEFDGLRVSFGKRGAASQPLQSHPSPDPAFAARQGLDESEFEDDEFEDAEPLPPGIPVTSPMTGIYYGSPSPGASPFAVPGTVIEAGQTIGLIEAMKVFNEVPAPIGGTVDRVAVENGAIVNVGDVILYLKS